MISNSSYELIILCNFFLALFGLKMLKEGFEMRSKNHSLEWLYEKNHELMSKILNNNRKIDRILV